MLLSDTLVRFSYILGCLAHNTTNQVQIRENVEGYWLLSSKQKMHLCLL